MSRVATVEFENVAVTAQVDFFELTSADDKPIDLIGLFISQHTEVASDVGRDEWARMRIIRGHTTSGSGGSTATPVPCVEGESVAFTCETNNTTIASAGTGVNLHSEAWNIRTGFQQWWPEGCAPRVRGTSLLVVRLMAAPSQSVSFSGTAYVREY